MNKPMKLFASVVALLVATFVVIKAADAEARGPDAATVASAQASEESAPALPLEQD